MTLSKNDTQVIWRLNELLEAGKKARKYADTLNEGEDSGKPNKTFTAFTYAPEADGLLSNLDVSEDQCGDVPPNEGELVQEPNKAETFDQPKEFEITRYEETIAELEAKIASLEKLKEQFETDKKVEFTRGLEEAKLSKKDEWEEAVDKIRLIVQEITELSGDKSEHFEPLKRLSIKIAEELVRGELKLNEAVIERLIREVLSDFNRNSNLKITIELNERDYEIAKKVDWYEFNIELMVDPTLAAGSVRASMADTAIEDLIEHRLAALSEIILFKNTDEGLHFEDESRHVEVVQSQGEGKLGVGDTEFSQVSDDFSGDFNGGDEHADLVLESKQENDSAQNNKNEKNNGEIS